MTRLLGTYITNPLLTPDGAGPTPPTYPPYTPPTFDYTYARYDYETEDWEKIFDFGASGQGQVRDIEIASDGTVWFAGAYSDGDYAGDATVQEYTNSGGTAGSGQTLTMFVASLDAADGTNLTSTGNVAGASYARAYALAMDEDDGYVYAGGRAGDAFYTTEGAYQEDFQGAAIFSSHYGPQDAAIMKVSMADGSLEAASYFGDASAGDFFRELLYNPHDDYLYGAIGKNNSANPSVVTNKLYRIRKDLGAGALLATFDPENPSNLSDGQPGLAVRGNKLAYVTTTTVACGAGTTSGAYDENFGTGTHARLFLAMFELTADGFTKEAATYFKSSNTAGFNMETHALTFLPNGMLALLCGNTSGGGVPVTANALISAHQGGGNGQGVFAVFTQDLSELVYCTCLNGGTSGSRCAPDSIKATPDGRVYIGFGTDDPGWPTTDGSTHPEELGTNRLLSLVLRPARAEGAGTDDPDANTNWEIEFCGYGKPGEQRAVGVGPNAEYLIGGIVTDAGSGATGPLVRQLSRTVAPEVFSRPGTSTDAHFVIDNPDLSLTDQMTFEFKGKAGLENNWTVFSELTGELVKLLVNTAGTVFARLGSTTAASSAVGVITANALHTIRSVVDGTARTHRVYVDDVLVATRTHTADYTFDSGKNITVLSNIDTSLADIEYIKIWNTAETDGSAPASAPVFVVSGYPDEANAHPNKTGAGSFS